jgi:hypothetical protein
MFLQLDLDSRSASEAGIPYTAVVPNNKDKKKLGILDEIGKILDRLQK